MENSKFTIDCWAFFGRVDWSIESVYEYIVSAKRIYELFGVKETHYGFSEIPYGTVKGAHIGSARNVAKKVETIYSKEAKLKTLEFFSLPKNYNYQSIWRVWSLSCTIKRFYSHWIRYRSIYKSVY